MSRNLISLLVIVLLTTLFVVLWDSPPESFRRTKNDLGKQTKYPQTYLTDIETTQYNEKGDISYTFSAKKVSYFQGNQNRNTKNDYTLIEAPNVVMLDPENPPWYATAKHGRANEDNTEITLWGNVKIWRTDSEGKKSELSSSEFVVKPNAQYAETNKPVMIRSADGVARAVGMKAFLKQDRIQLLSKVRGVHEAI